MKRWGMEPHQAEALLERIADLPVLVLFGLFVVFWHWPHNMRSRAFTPKLYRFFVDVFPERKTLGELEAEFPGSPRLVFRSLGFLMKYGFVSENVRSGIRSDDAVDTPEVMVKMLLLPGADSRSLDYLYEFSWSGKAMPTKSRSAIRRRFSLWGRRVLNS